MSKAEGQQSPKAARLRVLIADDVQETRRSTRLMMTLIPDVEVVAIAHNGREAIELAHKHRPDIALMDVKMPELGGLAAIQAMLQERPEMACIIISAERDTRTLQEAMAVGARGYLTKPFTSDQLVETFQRVADSVRANRGHAVQIEELQQQRDTYLMELANEYVRTRRMDDKALKVFEAVAANPNSDARWLMALAMIYVLRQEWGKLKLLAERLEKQGS